MDVLGKLMRGDHDPLSADHQLGPLPFFLYSVVIGVIASLGALFFRALIAFFHNLLFLGRWSLLYDSSLHTAASPWGAGVILVPVVGALGVAFVVQNFAPETKGHGVPEVMDAIYYKKGAIRPVVALIKSLASALSIGSGASVGREGPIVQIGSAFGSTLGQLLKLPAWQRITMIAAGAGGGIAATFNTPVGGVLFAIELLLHEVSVKTMVPVAIATATAAYLGQVFFGANPAFVIPAFQHSYFAVTTPEVLVGYLGLGAVTGIASSAYIKAIYGAEDLFEAMVPKSYYLRHAAGMLVSGTLIYLLFLSRGHYFVEGVGYATVQEILTGSLDQGWFLLLLFFLKLLATSLALGSGASGGVFSPALFLGATLGGAYGVLLHWLFPGLDISVPAFAVAGMAGLVGGATGAAVTAIVMILEMTFDYSVVIPLTVTVAMSYGVRSLLTRGSIYTMKLTRRGHYMPEALHTSVFELMRAREVMQAGLVEVSASQSLRSLGETLQEDAERRWVIVEQGGEVLSVVPRGEALAAVVVGRPTATAGELLHGRFIVVGEEAPLLYVLAALRRQEKAVALVTRHGGDTSGAAMVGVIDKEMIADATADAFAIFSGPA